jgi:hypothetical protein
MSKKGFLDPEPLLYYRVEFSLESELYLSPREPDLYIRPIHGEIYKYYDEEDENETAGVIRGYIIDIGCMINDGLLHEGADFMDAESQDLSDMSRVVFLDGDVRDLRKDGLSSGNVLILDQVVINEGHRGIGLATATVSKFIEVFGDGCSYVLCKPYPLEYSCRVKGDQEGFKKSKTRLKRMYQRLSFITLKNFPEYMALFLAYEKKPLWKEE